MSILDQIGRVNAIEQALLLKDLRYVWGNVVAKAGPKTISGAPTTPKQRLET